MNWDRIRPKNKWALLALTLTVGVGHFLLLMLMLNIVDPATASITTKAIVFVVYMGSIPPVYAFMDWLNGSRLFKPKDGQNG